MNRQNLLASIANTIKDYRQGEISPITPDHVDKWVSQFEKEDQLIILYEINNLLSKYYFSKSKTVSFLKAIFKRQDIFGENPSSTIPCTNFLNIQRKGSSQKDLIKLASNVAYNEYGTIINENISSPIGFIYLDDCIFSGNTVVHDLESLLSQNKLSNCQIYFVFLACHSSGIKYMFKRLQTVAKKKNIDLPHYFYSVEFENNDLNSDKYDCLWSKEVTNDNYVFNFVNLVSNNAQQKGWNPRLFRPDHVPSQETLFSSPQNRDIVEKAFLKKGAYICSLPKNRQKSMRPMGYEYLESLGFGSIFITYRNIANNCPLVLWWGDPSYSSSHPFSQWYPLFPRKVNEQSSIIMF
ncbi:hypothetical protein ACN4EE_07865 [Geminocystis sp. CENA526]|uniref:phosphoribosyltransferase-like protein n=1 Tax=Geminocystis sp. CENA526 TaxID=1355871 RepID=UPI003D6F93A4